MAAAEQSERSARQSLSGGLEAYGITIGSHVDPTMLPDIVAARVRAGEMARRAKELRHAEQQEREASNQLVGVLRGLGYEDGALEIQLERAIAAVSAARYRREGTDRTVPQLRATIAEHEVALQDGHNRGWADLPMPETAPTDPSLLSARRNDVAELINEADRPDLVGSMRRVETAARHIADLEARLAALTDGTTHVRDRLLAQARRSIRVEERTETLPLIIDDTLAAAPLPLRIDLLDALVQIAEETSHHAHR